MGLPSHNFACANLWKFEVQKRFIICSESTSKCFPLGSFLCVGTALPLPTNSLNIMVELVPVSSRAIIGTTVPFLFLISTIMSAVYCTGFFSLLAHVLVLFFD
jgi:hypothetical protein